MFSRFHSRFSSSTSGYSTMKVVITGGAGFLGLRLAKYLSQIGELTGPNHTIRSIDTITLFDVEKPSEPLKKEGIMIEAVTGDISDHRTVNGLIDRDDISVFHPMADGDDVVQELLRILQSIHRGFQGPVRVP